MWISDKTIVLHVPKTGGEFITYACKLSGISGSQPKMDSHTTINDLISKHNFSIEDIKNRYTIAFIRHPKERMRSLWSYFKCVGDMRDDFNTFVLKAIKDRRDLVVSDYEKFVLNSPVPINFIGKQENLVNDLVQALENAGEVFDKEKLFSEDIRVNHSDKFKRKAVYKPDVLAKLLEAEKFIVDKYYGNT